MAGQRFGARLRSLRESAGMNQSQLAMKVGTKQSAISRWERNAAEPKIALIERLAATFGMSAAELLTGRHANRPKRTIRLAADNFAEHLSTDYALSLVNGLNVPKDGVDCDDWIVSKLLAWLALESERSPDVQYEISRLVAAVFLERLAARC
jgi:transcriptional regulator with XRE-family HTH domain